MQTPVGLIFRLARTCLRLHGYRTLCLLRHYDQLTSFIPLRYQARLLGPGRRCGSRLDERGTIQVGFAMA